MKKLFTGILLALAMLLPLSARTGRKKQKNQKNQEEVILVGKVTVIPKMNMDFIAKSRRLTQENLEVPHQYTAPIFSSSATTRYEVDSLYVWFKDGAYFYRSYAVPDDRHMELKYLLYYFYGNRKLETVIPLAINFDVPEGTKALYLGDFTFTVSGDDFAVTGMQVSYSQEEAQAALDAAMKEQYTLKLADWKDNRPAKLVNYAGITGTPYDSVVFYGGLTSWNNDLVFAEISPIQLYPDQAKMNTSFFVSEPVRPGSRYMLRYWSSLMSKGIFLYRWQKVYTEETSPLIIEMPKEPGLYYFGYYDSVETMQKDTPVESIKNPSSFMQKAALKAALECYRGTVWEEYIQAELDKM